MNEQLKWAADIFFLLLPLLSIFALWVMFALSLLRKNKQLFRSQKEMELNLLAKIQFDFSYDFHDGIGSPLKVIRKELRELTDLIKPFDNTFPMVSTLNQITDELSQIQHSILNFQEVLYPSELLNGHLYDGLQRFQQIQSRNGFYIELTFPEFRPALQPYISLNVFRFIQETVLNMKQHTDLRFVEINVQCDEVYFYLEMVYKFHEVNSLVAHIDFDKKSRGALSLNNRIQIFEGVKTSTVQDGFQFDRIKIPLRLSQ